MLSRSWMFCIFLSHLGGRCQRLCVSMYVYAASLQMLACARVRLFECAVVRMCAGRVLFSCLCSCVKGLASVAPAGFGHDQQVCRILSNVAQRCVRFMLYVFAVTVWRHKFFLAHI